MTTIRLLDARRGLHSKCEELFKDAKIAELIYRFLCDGIEECEDAEPQRKKGKWIPYNPDEKGFANHFQCSECSVWQKMEVPHKTHDFDFCPNCGADMRKER